MIQYAAATARNREPILAVLQGVLPADGTVLEIASGTGEHAVFFAPKFPSLQWQPSDRHLDSINSINSWQAVAPSPNLNPAIFLDVIEPIWSVEKLEIVKDIQAIVCINMIHIAPWTACLGLMAGADRILPPGGILYLYGPFQQGGGHTAPSNETFDLSLQRQNPAWGVRHLEEVIAVAAAANLQFLKTVTMPANNLSVIWQKR